MLGKEKNLCSRSRSHVKYGQVAYSESILGEFTAVTSTVTSGVEVPPSRPDAGMGNKGIRNQVRTTRDERIPNNEMM